MSGFWIAAAVLGLIAAALVIVPLAKAWARDGERSSATLGVGLVGGLAIPVIALALYANWTSWDWSGGPVASQDTNAMHAMEEAVTGLEARLAAQPEDVEGWTMLGRSYMAMRRFDQAARAYRRGLQIEGADSPDLVADLGEALALSDPLGLQGEAGPLFETVLARSPNHPKALWYGGLYAFENSDFPKAEDRLGRLLTLNPPETLVPLIEERLTEARAHAGLPPETFAAAPDASAEAAAGGAPERRAAVPEESPAAEPESAPAQADGTPAEATAQGIRVEVSLDPGLAARIDSPAPLFIIARNPAGGPPLAVIRRSTAELPLSVNLTDDNAMMQGMSVTGQERLELVARVALSGSPAQNPGDLFGEFDYERGTGPVRIRIDRVAE